MSFQQTKPRFDRDYTFPLHLAPNEIEHTGTVSHVKICEVKDFTGKEHTGKRFGSKSFLHLVNPN